jgi:predicted nucleic acid-binding Zn ribbon protein
MENQIDESLELNKNKSCLNCGHSIEANENYCSNCGQAVDTERVLFKDLIIDILGYFFFYDYKLKNSLKLMLFKPGQLSLDFVRGKKADFIHPIRLYFIVSLIFFALASLNSNDDDDKAINITYSNEHQTDTIGSDFKKLSALFGVSDSSIVDSNLIQDSKNDKLSLLELFIIERKHNPKMSREAIFKKYNIEDTVINNFVFSKAEYSLRASIEDLVKVFQQKFKLLIFIFLPFFVVFMHLIHYKKDIYYYENLIFAFNTQTALFLLLIMGEIIGLFSEDISSYITAFIFLLAFPLYLYLALKRFYQYRSHKRAVVAFILINTAFLILSALFFVFSFISLYLIS